MRTPWRVAVLSVTLCSSAFTQRSWTDKAEYDLHRSIVSNTDPGRQIALIYEWEARYPQSEFKRERLQLLAHSNKLTGNTQEAFAAAVQLLNLDSQDADAHMLVVTIGPTLSNPSQEDISIISNAAKRLLMPRPVVKVVGFVFDPDQTPKQVVPVVEPGPPPSPPADTNLSPEAESQRVDFLIKDMRRNYRPAPVPPDPTIAQRAAAAAALEWLKTQTR
jgi:hypothetical protein